MKTRAKVSSSRSNERIWKSSARPKGSGNWIAWGKSVREPEIQTANPEARSSTINHMACILYVLFQDVETGFHSVPLNPFVFFFELNPSKVLVDITWYNNCWDNWKNRHLPSGNVTWLLKRVHLVCRFTYYKRWLSIAVYATRGYTWSCFSNIQLRGKWQEHSPDHWDNPLQIIMRI